MWVVIDGRRCEGVYRARAAAQRERDRFGDVPERRVIAFNAIAFEERARIGDPWATVALSRVANRRFGRA